VGVGAYLAYFALYMALVEFGIYWMHRLLHDIRPGYRQVSAGLPAACLYCHASYSAWSARRFCKDTYLVFCRNVRHLCHHLVCRSAQL